MVLYTIVLDINVDLYMFVQLLLAFTNYPLLLLYLLHDGQKPLLPVLLHEDGCMFESFIC